MFGALYVICALAALSLVNGLSSRHDSETPTQFEQWLDRVHKEASLECYAFDPHADALEQIGKQLEKHGNRPYAVRLDYKMATSGRIVETTTKVHFSEYRKPPVVSQTLYDATEKPSSFISFIYKPSSKSLVKVCNNAQHTARTVQRLDHTQIPNVDQIA